MPFRRVEVDEGSISLFLCKECCYISPVLLAIWHFNLELEFLETLLISKSNTVTRSELRNYF